MTAAAPASRATPLRIALLGAESTGKSTLARAMAGRLEERGHRVAVVDEVLREWCAREGRTPRPEEQMPIAQEQERRVEAACAGADIVIADTTALVVAIYSGMLFRDRGIYPYALERQRTFHLTLLTGLDLPWVADGLQRDGPHSREPMDALLREALALAQVDWRVVYGAGEQRTLNALQALAEVAPWAWQAEADPADIERWSRLRATCEKCGDASCEHRLFTGLTGRT
ncbi:AAA family ATPase [Ramlibacter sp. MAHUQ-53]|uniref:AAA family ATPase n=1 Tax=unclassified Ramlibacter TaxID=2617605 RepID=UPI003630EBBD